jgi:hypothetical protein
MEANVGFVIGVDEKMREWGRGNEAEEAEESGKRATERVTMTHDFQRQVIFRFRTLFDSSTLWTPLGNLIGSFPWARNRHSASLIVAGRNILRDSNADPMGPGTNCQV